LPRETYGKVSGNKLIANVLINNILKEVSIAAGGKVIYK
jgi:hypothetical protein